ncbi:unnamed protein product [Protopolystoma xenopodis]|uniref:Uncharacterized protein n=1 Tax=Protopolystoma xenopodis TaxID=117903 RepID=A0A3S5BC25_9PLAT|nr:unnamed protein product [Protopolystoma xenopodis]
MMSVRSGCIWVAERGVDAIFAQSSTLHSTALTPPSVSDATNPQMSSSNHALFRNENKGLRASWHWTCANTLGWSERKMLQSSIQVTCWQRSWRAHETKHGSTSRRETTLCSFRQSNRRSSLC